MPKTIKKKQKIEKQKTTKITKSARSKKNIKKIIEDEDDITQIDFKIEDVIGKKRNEKK